jgi:hypothetical protein
MPITLLTAAMVAQPSFTNRKATKYLLGEAKKRHCGKIFASASCPITFTSF